MKVGVLFSGGKDSTLAAFLAKQHNHKLSCLISIISENPYSFMFHTPSISKVKKQAEVMDIPLIEQKTKGKEEIELADLKKAIKKAKDKFDIEGIVTGAVESVYQASRIQKICNKLGLDVFNPLWLKDQFELLDDLIKNKFKVIISGVAAFPLDESLLGRFIDKKFLEDISDLNKKFKISPAGEGGEFESFVLDCPLFSRPLKIKDKIISGKDNNFRLEVVLE